MVSQLISTVTDVLRKSLSFISPVTQMIRESIISPIAATLNAEAWFVTLLISVAITMIATRTRIMKISGWLKLTLISASLFVLLWVI